MESVGFFLLSVDSDPLIEIQALKNQQYIFTFGISCFFLFIFVEQNLKNRFFSSLYKNLLMNYI